MIEVMGVKIKLSKIHQIYQMKGDFVPIIFYTKKCVLN